MEKNNFEIISRAVIVDRGKILLCQVKGRDYYYLPGGHVNFGESAEEALRREIKEEMDVSTKTLRFIGVVENIFNDGKEKHHELNLVFDTKIGNNNVKSIEDHLEFYWKDVKKLSTEKILPEILKKIFLNGLKTKKFFGRAKID